MSDKERGALTELAQTRMSKAQMVIVEDAAEREGLSMAAFLRNAALRAARKEGKE